MYLESLRETGASHFPRRAARHSRPSLLVHVVAFVQLGSRAASEDEELTITRQHVTTTLQGWHTLAGNDSRATRLAPGRLRHPRITYTRLGPIHLSRFFLPFRLAQPLLQRYSCSASFVAPHHLAP